MVTILSIVDDSWLYPHGIARLKTRMQLWQSIIIIYWKPLVTLHW